MSDADRCLQSDVVPDLGPTSTSGMLRQGTAVCMVHPLHGLLVRGSTGGRARGRPVVPMLLWALREVGRMLLQHLLQPYQVLFLSLSLRSFYFFLFLSFCSLKMSLDPSLFPLSLSARARARSLSLFGFLGGVSCGAHSAQCGFCGDCIVTVSRLVTNGLRPVLTLDHIQLLLDLDVQDQSGLQGRPLPPALRRRRNNNGFSSPLWTPFVLLEGFPPH